MKICKIKLDKEHWTTDCIPLNYSDMFSKKQCENSMSFYWATKYNLHAMCRAYYVNKNEVQIGDVWVSEELRGKKINNVKISLLFMRQVITKIWQHFTTSNTLSLLVHNDNISALKLYSKLNFQIMRNDINIPELKMKNGYKMVRYKKNVV
jgi:ribosomal protein S18 acetylase RimI-like enzyme